ncbi:putative mariner transposase [Trichonephila clavipes]|nr:putative mariner transposase [Trichonephila clavipes]
MLAYRCRPRHLNMEGKLRDCVTCHWSAISGLEDVKDDSRPDRPSTSKTDDNIEEISNLVPSDHQLSTRAIADGVEIDKERDYVYETNFSYNSFGIQNVCAEMVFKILILEPQEDRKNVGTNTLNTIENNPKLLKRSMTCVESWFFTYKPETNPCTGQRTPNDSQKIS